MIFISKLHYFHFSIAILDTVIMTHSHPISLLTCAHRHVAEQKRRGRTTNQVPQTQPSLLADDALAAALGAIPVDDWCSLI